MSREQWVLPQVANMRSALRNPSVIWPCIQYLNRRDFLQNAAKAALLPTVAVHLPVLGHAVPTAGKSDIALRIEPATLDIGPGVSIRTVASNGQVPGPTLRLKEGIPVAIDVTNATPNEEIV